MSLYHYTSSRHLRGIRRFGLTVGDVPTSLTRNEGRVGVWLTSSESADGHGLETSAVNKRARRLTVDLPAGSYGLVRWNDWRTSHVDAATIAALEINSQADTWWIHFRPIPVDRITDCVDMGTGKGIEGWGEGPMDGDDMPGVRPDSRSRAIWHKRLLRRIPAVLIARRTIPPYLV